MTKLTTERKELLVAWDIEYMQAIAAAAQAKADLLHGAPLLPLQHSTGGLGGGGGRLWTACGQRCVGSKNSQTTPATTSTTPNTPTTGRR